MFFTETQTAGWLFNIVVSALTLAVVILFWNRLKKPEYRWFMLPFILLVISFMLQWLNTRIDDSGIHYRMFPFQRAERTIPWQQIDRIYISNKINYPRYHQLYNTYTILNTWGIFIYLNDGSRIILGTHKPLEADSVLSSLPGSAHLLRRRRY